MGNIYRYKIPKTILSTFKNSIKTAIKTSAQRGFVMIHSSIGTSIGRGIAGFKFRIDNNNPITEDWRTQIARDLKDEFPSVLGSNRNNFVMENQKLMHSILANELMVQHISSRYRIDKGVVASILRDHADLTISTIENINLLLSEKKL